MSDVIDIKEAKKSKKKDAESVSEAGKVPLHERFRILSMWLDDPAMVAGLPEPWWSATPIHKAIGGRVVICQESERNREPVWLLAKKNSLGMETVSVVSVEYLATKICGWLSHNARGFEGCGKWAWDFDGCLKFLKSYMCRSLHQITEMPESIGFASTPGLVFNRTSFDPSLGVCLQATPVFSELIERITENKEAFMLSIARLFDPRADRKQAVWLSGPSDCGKSQLQAWLAWLCGSAYCSMTGGDLRNPHWREKIVGKRVVCVTEARPEFLNTDDFKSITGDSLQSINPKWKPMYDATLKPLMFFFSNKKPVIEGAEEIARRIIYCPIAAIPKGQDELITDKEYQAQLFAETEAFVSRCWEAYKPYQGRRIPVSRERMNEVIDHAESWAIDIFDKLFVAYPDGCIAGGDMNDLLRAEHIHRGVQRNQLLDIWERRYNVVYKSKRINGKVTKVWHGIRLSTRAQCILSGEDKWTPKTTD